MPVILRIRGYKFWFYEADLGEPPHIHVGKDGNEAKFWLNPIRVARAGRFRQADLFEIERIIIENQEFIMHAWEKEQNKHGNS
jgi:hypothetical protein